MNPRNNIFRKDSSDVLQERLKLFEIRIEREEEKLNNYRSMPKDDEFEFFDYLRMCKDLIREELLERKELREKLEGVKH